VQSLKA